MPDTFTIPEMQKVKEKYPQYKDVPDDALLSAVSKKFPVYQKLADKYQGSMTQRKPDLNDMLGYQSDDVKYHPIKEAIAGTLQGQFMNRPFGAIRAMTAGKSPIEGFQRPDETWRLYPHGCGYSRLRGPCERAPAARVWHPSQAQAVSDV